MKNGQDHEYSLQAAFTGPNSGGPHPAFRKDEIISIVIKTMDRPYCLKRLVNDIHTSDPNCTIYIADDGVDPVQISDINPSENSRIKYFRMPYDSGLSAGRNLLLSQVTTPLFLLLDDDFSWQPSLKENFLSVIEQHPQLDIVGGRAGLPFAGQFQVTNDTLFLVSGEHATLEDVNCSLVDFVPNFFLGKTERVRQLAWDSELKVGEHEDFFLRARKATPTFSVAFCPWIIVENLQEICSDTKDKEKFEKQNYKRQMGRARAFWFMSLGLRKHGLLWLAYCMGDSLAGPGWQQLPFPFSSNDQDRLAELPKRTCWRVPLPETCPLGWTGTKCDRCAEGFRGSGCTECTVNHYGRYCQFCECGKGGHCQVRSGDHKVFCRCNANYFGANCSFLTQATTSNLLQEPDFGASKLTLGQATKWTSSVWGPWKDGCVQFTLLGNISLEANGKNACGLGQEVVLEQTRPEPLICEASVTATNTEIVDLQSARICLYIDLSYMNGTTLWGKRSCYDLSESERQTEHILLHPEDSLKWVRVFIVTTGVKSNIILNGARCFVPFLIQD